MDEIDYNPRMSARRDEELAIIVRNEEQSAPPNLQHAWTAYYYAVMMLMQFANIPPPPNIGRLEYNPTILPLSTRGAQQHDILDETPPGFTLQSNQGFGRYCGLWLAVVATYVAMCTFLVSYMQLKYQSENHSPFETHLGFIIMSIAAFFITIFTSWILAYTNNKLQSLMKENFSPVYDLILKIVFCFSTSLLPLSLLLILFIPPKLNWTGYLLVCALFLAILAFNLKSLKRLLAPERTNNLGASEMDP